MKLGTGGALAAAALVLGLGGTSPAAAAGDKDPCGGNAARLGDLGIQSLDCDCTFETRPHSESGRRIVTHRWRFRSEPRVSGIRDGGPAAGKLREDDVVTAIDGVLITTREGARRFSEVAPGAHVTLTVRRDGREHPVRLVADSVCPEDLPWFEGFQFDFDFDFEARAPVVPETPVVPDVPVAPEAPTPVESPRHREAPEARSARRLARLPRPEIPTEDALPRGWSGFGLTCSNCGGAPGDSGKPPVWEFGTLPTIYIVEPGSPAGRAGIQIGDVLTHLDGVSLLTKEGGRRFGALQPGQRVRWTVLRGGRVIEAKAVTERRPGSRNLRLDDLQETLRGLGEGGEAERLSEEITRASEELARRGLLTPTPRARSHRLRYAGTVGGSEVEVHGLGNVVVDDSGDVIVITTRDATIRIRPAAKSASTPAPRRAQGQSR
jgi:hypothetical protein